MTRSLKVSNDSDLELLALCKFNAGRKTHSLVASATEASAVHIVCLLYVYRVSILCLSCVYFVSIVCLSCVYLVSIVCLSCVYRVSTLCLSCLCRVYLHRVLITDPAEQLKASGSGKGVCQNSAHSNGFSRLLLHLAEDLPQPVPCRVLRKSGPTAWFQKGNLTK